MAKGFLCDVPAAPVCGLDAVRDPWCLMGQQAALTYLLQGMCASVVDMYDMHPFGSRRMLLWRRLCQSLRDCLHQYTQTHQVHEALSGTPYVAH